MDRNQIRLEIRAQITAQKAERDGTQDPAKKAAAGEAIAALQARRAQVNVAAADALGDLVDALLDELEEIQTRHALDAVSALGRSIQRFKALTDDGANGGG